MEKVNLNRILRDIEIEYIKRALEESGGNIDKAATLLGQKRNTLSLRISTLQIEFRRARKLAVRDDIGTKNPVLLSSPNNIEADLWNE